MANISIDQIKKLKELSGVGLTDAKNALFITTHFLFLILNVLNVFINSKFSIKFLNS